MATKILNTTIMQKSDSGDRIIIYPKTVAKNVIDGSTSLDQTLETLKSPDISSKTTEFSQAETRENLVSGESLATSHGKIMKLISDLKSLAYSDKVGVSNLDTALTSAYNNRITTDKVTTSTTITTAGYVADARSVNSLQNQINSLDSGYRNIRDAYINGDTDLQNQINILNKNIGYTVFVNVEESHTNGDLIEIVKKYYKSNKHNITFMVSNSVSNIPPENSWYIIHCIVQHWSDTIRIKAYATWSNSVYICNFNYSRGQMDFDWEKLISNTDLTTKQIEWTDLITENGKYKILTNDITKLSSKKYLPYVTDGNAGDAWIIDATKYDYNLIGLVAVQVNASKRGGFGRLDLRTKEIVWAKFEQ